MSATDATVLVQKEVKKAILSLDRVEKAPVVKELINREVLQDEKHGIPYERADEKVTAKSNDSAQAMDDYYIDRLVDYANGDVGWKFKVR